MTTSENEAEEVLVEAEANEDEDLVDSEDKVEVSK
jgi:hypothetical protein